MRQRRTNICRRVKNRLSELNEMKVDGVPILEGEMVGSSALGRLLGVTDETVRDWRKEGLIKSREIAPRIHVYNLENVYKDLVKLK